MGKKRVCRGLMVIVKARDHLEDLGGDGTIILKWIFKE
jgi:hypothetical protein